MHTSNFPSFPTSFPTNFPTSFPTHSNVASHTHTDNDLDGGEIALIVIFSIIGFFIFVSCLAWCNNNNQASTAQNSHIGHDHGTGTGADCGGYDSGGYDSGGIGADCGGIGDSGGF